MLRLIAVALAGAAFLTTHAAAQPIAIERFMALPVLHGADLSPDGRRIAIVQHTEENEQLIIADLQTGDARLIQHIKAKTGYFRWVEWKGNDRVIFGATMLFDLRGRPITEYDEDRYYVPVDRVLAMRPEPGQPVQMFEGQRTRLAGFGTIRLIDELPNDPDHVLLLAWDHRGAGAWRTSVTTGAAERVVGGLSGTYDYATDSTGYPVLRFDWNDPVYRIWRRAPQETDWTFALEARPGASTSNSPDFSVIASGPAPGRVYVFARPEDADLGGLYLYNTATGELGEPIQAGARADVGPTWLNPVTREVFATCEWVQRLTCKTRDPTAQRHLNGIDTLFNRDATVGVADISDDQNTWLLYVERPTEPGRYYVYHRATAQLEAVGAPYAPFEPGELAPVQTVDYRARDGTQLWAYVTKKPGSGPRPMVVLPHGGPEVRDFYGYDPFTQFLASRGYVVVQPNFRGSLGFGRAFADAGRGQWGKRMQDDVTDAAQHFIDAGLADPSRVCIVGISYGGYAALAGAALTPDLYRCAVSIAGVSDLIESLRDERRSGGSYAYWRRSIGDPRADREALIAASPRRHADSIRVPVLLLHGEEDGIVDIEQSEMMEEALREAGKSVRFVRYEHEGHPFRGWTDAHRLAVYKEVETFLGVNLVAAESR